MAESHLENAFVGILLEKRVEKETKFKPGLYEQFA